MAIVIRLAQSEDAEKISALVMREFDTFIAPDYDQAGRETFATFAAAAAIAGRLGGASSGLVACETAEIVGFMEMRGDHVAMLFVKSERHRRGIARRLLERALVGREGAEITVNAAPYAEPTYERLGFRAVGEWTVENGMKFLPMARRA